MDVLGIGASHALYAADRAVRAVADAAATSPAAGEPAAAGPSAAAPDSDRVSPAAAQSTAEQFQTDGNARSSGGAAMVPPAGSSELSVTLPPEIAAVALRVAGELCAIAPNRTSLAQLVLQQCEHGWPLLQVLLVRHILILHSQDEWNSAGSNSCNMARLMQQPCEQWWPLLQVITWSVPGKLCG